MGGLARTCEIFNASKLVVDDVAVTRTAEFQGVSMAAEHWLPIEGVSIARLYEWLQVRSTYCH
jgi:tRNA guanosine-2'-O-methyltransferase